jgi:predicted PurR-regulated permease PerM/phosphoglycolate phosphatase-like HAD superfamily hydrolase
MTSRRWSNVTKIIVTTLLVLFALGLVVTFRAMIQPTIVAFLFAFILSYPVNWLQRQTGWARSTAVLVLYGLLAAGFTVAPALLIPRIVGLSSSLQQTLTDLIASLQTIDVAPGGLFGDLHLSADNLLQQLSDALQNVLLSTANPLSILQGVTNSVLLSVYVLVLNFWLLTDLHKLRRLIFEQIPVDYQEDLRRLAYELSETWQAFLRGQIVLGLVIGIITWIPLAIVGMKNAGGLALLAGVMEFLPNVGQGISGTIGTTVALFQGSTWLPVGKLTFALIVLLIYVVIAQIENVYLVPRLVGGRVKLHPAVAFVSTICGGVVFGVLGVLLAMPVVASIRVILLYLYNKLLDREPFEPVATAQTGVRIRGLIAGRKIEAVIFDLDGTLAHLDWSVVEWSADHLSWLDRFFSPDQRRSLTRRLLIQLEGSINFLFSQVRRTDWEQHPRWQKLLPLLDRWRGYPCIAELTPLPAVAPILSQLTRSYRLALISTRNQAGVDQFLRKANLDRNVFAVIITREGSHNLLPHGEGLETIANRLELQPRQLLMVSDTDVNLRAARAMQMATIGVLSGLGREQDLRDADLVLPTVIDLEDWL